MASTLTKINLTLIVLLIIGSLFFVYYTNKKFSINEQTDKLLLVNTDNIKSQANKIENFIESSGLSCVSFKQDPWLDGDNICKENNYQFCLFSEGDVEEAYFKSTDRSCSGGLDFKYYRTLRGSCDPFAPQTYQYQTFSNGGATAKCLNGGSTVNQDFWLVLLDTKSLCCKYTSNGQIKEQGKVVE